MIISNFKPQDQSKTLSIQDNEIIHIISDKTLDLKNLLSLTGINYTNCAGVIIDKMFSVRGKNINNIDYIKTLEENKISQKILYTIPDKLSSKKYALYDHTQLGNHLISSGISTKILPIYLFENLKESYDAVQIKNKSYKQNTIIFLNTLKGFYEIIPILSNVITSKTAEDFKVFDNYTLVCVVYENDTLFFPLLTINTKTGYPYVIKANLSKIETLLRSIDKSNTKATDQSNVDSVSTNKKLANVKADEIVSSENINNYSDLLKKFNIRDPSIANSIAISINSYVKEQNKPGSKKLSEDDLLLKAVHKTIFGNDTVSAEYQEAPSKLLSKLEEFNTFSKPILYPTLKNETIIHPKHIIKLDKVTSPVRHEYEFGDNIDNSIRDLFKTLEKKKYPVKILNIKREDKDNNMDRYIEYTISIKNASGGLKQPYDIKIRIPTLINKKYFKLNGKEYIMASQRFLMPITKDKSNETRLITHYGMIRTKIVNLKYTSSDIQKILQYILNKYPSIVKSYLKSNDSYSYIELSSDGTIIKPYDSDFMTNFNYDQNTRIVTNNGKTLSFGRNEVIYGKLLDECKRIDPAENFKSSKRSIDYLEAHISGTKMPIIFLYWQQLGLIEALHKCQIDFSIGKSPLAGLELSNMNTFELAGGNNLYIYFTSIQKKQELIANGLLTGTMPKYLKSIKQEDLANKISINSYISEKYGKSRPRDFDRLVENMIDPVSLKLFAFKDEPTDVLSILNGPVMNKLFNGEIEHRSDLSTQRVRQAEYLTHLLYNEVSMAYNKYTNDLEYDSENAKLYFDEKYTIRNLMGQHEHSGNAGSIMDYVNPFSPIDEICKSTKVVMTGKGGVPTKRAFVKQQRNIHPSYIGNISAYSTTESGDVGLKYY